MSTALTITGNVPGIGVAPDALKRRDDLVAEARTITAVANPLDYEAAGNVLVDLKRLAREVEDQRKTLKAPILDLGRKLDAVAEAFVSHVTAETTRVGRLLVAYDAEQARQRAESERKAREEAARLERQRQEEIARAKREADEAQRKADEALRASVKEDGKEEAANEAAQAAVAAAETARAVEAAPAPAVVVAPSPVAPKVAGLRKREVWVVEVTDVAALYAARPDLVELLPRLASIQKALDAGDNIPGVAARKEVRL